MTKLIEHTFATPAEVGPGVLRVTLPLPSGPRHVHCFLLRGDDGWTLVDTGLGLLEPTWEEILAQVDGPVARIFITHMHPDHVGGAEAAAQATGAPVFQEELIESGHVFADFVRFAWNPTLVEAGDSIDGWEVLASPGHADGHLCLYRDGVLVAGDTLLAPITPAIGLYPESRPDPLGDYTETLRALAHLDPRVSYGGHGETIDEPGQRAHAILAHHDERLDRTEAALGPEPRTGYDVSLALFGSGLPAIQRRFAVAETLSHLERLVVLGRARRDEDDRIVSYTGA